MKCNSRVPSGISGGCNFWTMNNVSRSAGEILSSKRGLKTFGDVLGRFSVLF